MIEHEGYRVGDLVGHDDVESSISVQVGQDGVAGCSTAAEVEIRREGAGSLEERRVPEPYRHAMVVGVCRHKVELPITAHVPERH